MSLSDLIIRQAKATGKTYNLPDTDGLGLVVSPVGGKSWHFRYYWLGKQKRISLGGYPEIGLREARAVRDEARALLAKGVNPHTERKLRRHAIKLASEYTFKAVFDAWVNHRRKELKEGRQTTLSQILRIFNKDVLPSLGKMSVYEIRRPQLLGVLARIEERKAHTMAEKVRTWLSQLFRYALVIFEGLESNPATDLDVVAEPKPPVKHNPFLRLPALPEMLKKLRGYARHGMQTQLGLRLLLLTGVRTGELRLATPEQFHLDEGLWIIPPEIVKQLQDEMRKTGKRPQDIPPYVVPLSTQAIEIVRYLLDRMKPAQRYLLAGRDDLKKRISENTLNGALRRMGYQDLLTGHGIRATISTALNEFGYPKIWVDAQLSHEDPDKVSSAYNHAEYVEPRRKMMQDWSDRLDLLEQDLVVAASTHLTIHIEGAATANAEGVQATVDACPADGRVVQRLVAPTIPNAAPVAQVQIARLSPVQAAVPAEEPALSDVQRERLEMLAAYESTENLPVHLFGKLAGKSKDQINRDIKARRLIALTVGNRGQRVPEWQLDPVKQKFVEILLSEQPGLNAWDIYRFLTSPHPKIDNQVPVNVVCLENIAHILRCIRPRKDATSLRADESCAA